MILGTVEWGYCSDGTIDLVFTNHITGVTETRNYKTHRSAACAETKFHNRMTRLHSAKLADRIEVHTPLDYDEQEG